MTQHKPGQRGPEAPGDGHAHEPAPGSIRDWSGIKRIEDNILAFDYPLNALCRTCEQLIHRDAGSRSWQLGSNPDACAPAGAAQPASAGVLLADGERVTTMYDVPGSSPVLTLGITSRARVLFGIRAGKGWAFQPDWAGAITGSLTEVQAMLEQVITEQKLAAEPLWPLDQRITRVLRTRPGIGYTALEIADTLAVSLSQVKDELTSMINAKQVTWLVDVPPRYIMKNG